VDGPSLWSSFKDPARETLANPSKWARLRRFADEPVAEIVQCGEPPPKALVINNLQDQPNRSIELPQRKSLIERLSRQR
jgi:hypothetical protein